MRYKSKVLVFLLTLIMSLNTFSPMVVYSAPENEQTNSGDQAKLDAINASMNRSAKLDILLSIYAALKASDVDDEHCAALLVNGMRESSLTPDAGQSGGGAIGIWQWDGDGRRGGLQSYSQSVGDTQYSIKGYNIGGIATQVGFLLQELTGGQWIQNKPSSLYHSVDWTEAKNNTSDTSVDYSSKMSIDEWLACKDTVALSIYFTACFERCAYRIDIYEEGAKQSKDMYSLITGAEVEGNTNEDLDEDLATLLVGTGFWDETEFVKWKEITNNITLEFADIEQFSDADIYEVETWKSDIEKQNGDSILITGGRWLAILCGIIINIWMLLIYIAYWFDRINNIFEISLLNILTFGRLRISPDENECTFSLTGTDTKERTINHKKILVVCIIGLGFGTLIVSGVLFEIIQVLVNKILDILY